jgi:two-component system, response regulator YesN
VFGVLVVDDEMVVRYGIRSMVDWEKIALTVVGDAANGKEALELFHRLKPDIVITDIKMPVMDGIELIQKIRAVNTETKIVILSCYEDFSYAREAVRFGAAEYLIKSDMMPADFEQILLRLKDSLIHERVQQENFAEIQGKMQETESIIKEKFLWDLSLGVIAQPERFQDTLQRLGIDYLQQNLILFEVGIDYFEKVTSEYSENQKKELMQSLDDGIREAISGSPECRGEIYPGNSGELNVILTIRELYKGKNAVQTAQSIARRVVQEVEAKLGQSITIGLSDCFNEIGRLKQAYSETRHAYQYKRFFGCGRVICYSDTVTVEVGKQQSIRANIKELQDDVYLLDSGKTQAFLDQLFRQMEQNRDYEEINLIALELVLTLSNIYVDVCDNNEDMSQKKKEYYQQIQYLETVADIKNWFKAAYSQLIDDIRAVYNQDRNVIAKAVHFINIHYHQDISLTDVSEYVHLSKNYFTHLFKKEAGESFVEYLTKLRMEKAKLLLQNSDLRTAEVGEAVGVFDSHYFSKVFKRNTGLSPTEFKDVFRKK